MKVEYSKGYIKSTQQYYYIADIYRRKMSKEKYNDSHVIQHYSSKKLKEVEYRVTEYLKSIGVKIGKINGLKL